MSEPDLFDRLAFDIFIADGGVDDHELMTDQELKAIVAWWLRAHAEDDVFLSLVVRASRGG